MTSVKNVNEIKQHKHLVKIIQKYSNHSEKQFEAFIKECKSYFQFPLTKQQEKVLKSKLSAFKGRYVTKWRQYHRMENYFNEKEGGWLNKYITVPMEWFDLPSPTEKTNGGRKPKTTRKIVSDPPNIPGEKLPFENLTTRGQEKIVQKTTQKFQALPSQVILTSTKQVLAQRNQKAASIIIKKMQQNAEAAEEILSCIQNKKDPVEPYGGDEALALLLELNLTERSYKLKRKIELKKGSTLYPSYHNIIAAKSRCYPDNVKVTSSSAFVSVKDLLYKTASRIVQLNKEPILSILRQPASSSQDCTLFGIYGFDGSSNHSIYNYKNDMSQTESLFATTFTPMRLVSERGNILWQNPCPQSTRFCRPVKIEYIKETIQKIIQERDEMEKQIRNLENLLICLENITLSIKFDLRLTAIDGKVLQVITGVTNSTRACPLCACNPKEFNNVENFYNGKFDAHESKLVHGVSPLHSWIRFYEFCLRLAYRKPAGVYPVTKDKDKVKYANKKKKVQKDMKRILGLRVDIVKKGGGTTNNGNSARRAFQSHKKFAEILGIDNNFVERLHNILVTMSLQFSVDAVEFGKYCRDTFRLYCTLYEWHPMSVTLHRVLVHGRSIIENSPLPLGMMSEEGAESRNKNWRQDRYTHARQMNNQVNLTDVFQRAFETSDPIISSFFVSLRNNLRNRMALPHSVMKMLRDPVVSCSIHELPNLGNDGDSNSQEAPFVQILDNCFLEGAGEA